MTLVELDQLNNLKKEIKEDQLRLEAIRARAYGSTSKPSGAPGGGANESRISRYYPLIESLTAVIESKIDESIREAERLERYISSIPDSFTRRIFKYRFLDGLIWQDVAQKLGGGNSWKSVSNICYRYIEKSNS